MRIGDREIGPDHPPYIIAELGVNHDGSVERALELTRAAKTAGADAIKLQYFETDRLMSKDAKLAAYQKAAGETDPVAMLRRLELTIEQMEPVVALAHELGLHAIVTVFSTELVASAERLPWDAYKTASPDIIHKPLLEALAATGRPMIVSTGASTMEEVQRTLDWLGPAHDRLALMQCVSCYPAPEDRAEIGGIRALAAVFDGPVGYSDHTRGNGTGAVAVAWGAALLEKHLTYSRRAVGPDHAASLTGAMMSKYVGAARQAHGTWEQRDRLRDRAVVEEAWKQRRGREWPSEAKDVAWRAKLLDPWFVKTEDKRVLDIEQDVRTLSRQSLVAVRALRASHCLASADLTCKRPGTGIPPYERAAVLGRPLARDIKADRVITWDDLA